MDNLPSDVGLIVCGLVEVTDIQSLRLVSKFHNELATPFLLSGVQLVLHPDSFDRLQAISQHPVLRRQVKALYYEPDVLDKYESQEEWEYRVVDKRKTNVVTEYIPNLTSYEDHEDLEDSTQALKRVDWNPFKPQHTCSSGQLNAGYTRYQKLYRSQQNLKRARYGSRELLEAMSYFPNLQDFTMTIDCSEKTSNYLEHFYAAGLIGPLPDFGQGHAVGVPQLQSVYRSAFRSGTKFKSFARGEVSWQLFKATRKDLVEFASVLSKCHRFRLYLWTGFNKRTQTLGLELPQCRRYLANGCIRDLLSQAERLESLRLFLDHSGPLFGVDLKNVVGDHTWSRLSHISFGNVEGSADGLVAFVNRHALSLRSLHLEDFSLTSGQWIMALPRIRASFKYTPNVTLGGNLSSQNPLRTFCLDKTDLELLGIFFDRRRSLEEWFKNGGDCPLVEEWSSV